MANHYESIELLHVSIQCSASGQTLHGVAISLKFLRLILHLSYKSRTKQTMDS